MSAVFCCTGPPLCLHLGQGAAWQELSGSGTAVLQVGTLPHSASAHASHKWCCHCLRNLWQVAPHMITCEPAVHPALKPLAEAWLELPHWLQLWETSRADIFRLNCPWAVLTTSGQASQPSSKCSRCLCSLGRAALQRSGCGAVQRMPPWKSPLSRSQTRPRSSALAWSLGPSTLSERGGVSHRILEHSAGLPCRAV